MGANAPMPVWVVTAAPALDLDRGVRAAGWRHEIHTLLSTLSKATQRDEALGSRRPVTTSRRPRVARRSAAQRSGVEAATRPRQRGLSCSRASVTRATSATCTAHASSCHPLLEVIPVRVKHCGGWIATRLGHVLLVLYRAAENDKGDGVARHGLTAPGDRPVPRYAARNRRNRSSR